jgi:MFS family permease
LKLTGGTGRLNPVRNIKSVGLPSGRPGLFHGYWIVVAAFVCLFIFAGFGYYAFGLFVTPIQSDMGWDRADIMAAFTVFFLVQGLASPLIGWALCIVEPRKMIAAGAFAVTLGFILLSRMEDHRSFYLSYALVGAGMAAMGHVPVSTVISNWYKRRRGTAIGIASNRYRCGRSGAGTIDWWLPHPYSRLEGMLSVNERVSCCGDGSCRPVRPQNEAG